MTIKKLLIIFLLLIPFSVARPLTVILENYNFSESLFDKFVADNLDDSKELPDLHLLKTALAGYELLQDQQTLSRPGVITIIDYSLPSNEERLWVIDLVKAKVIYRTLVSHGRNSGELMAEKFSNKPGSYASSPGFYATGETYKGKHGLSLKLDGLEKGINDNARERAIVVHGADYVSPDFITQNGRLGRSLGCPAVPEELSKEIIETIKGGSCFFIYVPKASYTSNSSIINRINYEPKG
jgi:hypothetical protein